MTIRKSDWDAAAGAWTAEQRGHAGPPPDEDEVLAFFEGKLAPAEAERIRELLIVYPELARVAMTPFPEDAAEDAAVLSDAEMAEDWTALRARLSPAPPRPDPRLGLWRSFALAASLAVVVLGVLLVRTTLTNERTIRMLQSPRVNVEPRYLLPEGSRRGPGDTPSTAVSAESDALLVLTLFSQTHYPGYRIEIRDPGTNRTLWTAEGIERRDDDTFELWIPAGFLQPGTYQVAIHGLEGGRGEVLGRYAFRVAGKQGSHSTERRGEPTMAE